MRKKIIVKDIGVNFFSQKSEDFISLTDIARYKDRGRSDYILQNWLRNRNTIEFLGLWERINNENFKPIEFDGFKSKSGLNSFSLTPKKWIEGVNAIGIISKIGRGGGTFAHKDIAFEFASWISAEFKLYLIKEFQRLKEEESNRRVLGWDARRMLTKINYKIHTDAIKEHIIPKLLSNDERTFVYANEADVLNMALFGITAKAWRARNSDKDRNVRNYADVRQLVCLANLESMNAELIRQKMSQSERLIRLNEIAIVQMRSLVDDSNMKKLEG